MRYLKKYESREYDIHTICRKYGIRNYTINKNGSIDVDADAVIQYMNLEKLPLKFGDVSCDFSCSSNKLTSLEGCPKSVGGYFYCYGNHGQKY
jgi:hypothetical protein